MFGQVIACLDGSSLAEKILPLARGVTIAAGGRLTLLRVVEDAAELAAEEKYQRDCARQYGRMYAFAFHRTRLMRLSPSSSESLGPLRRRRHTVAAPGWKRCWGVWLSVSFALQSVR